EGGVFQNSVETSISGRASFVPGRLVAPEQSVCMRPTVAQAVQGDGTSARWNVVLYAFGHFQDCVLIREDPLFVLAQTASLLDTSAHSISRNLWTSIDSSDSGGNTPFDLLLEWPRVLHKEVQQECSEGRAASLRIL